MYKILISKKVTKFILSQSRQLQNNIKRKINFLSEDPFNHPSLDIKKMKGYDNYDIEIWEGIPYVEILKFSREKQGDLIVMAHHTRDIEPEQALLGSTVEQVVLRAACPVASVNHPDKVADMEG